MKLNAEKRIVAVSMGLFCSWKGVLLMFSSAYGGLQQTIKASVHGGTYPVLILQPLEFVIWFVFMLASCILLAIGLVAEEKETSTGA